MHLYANPFAPDGEVLSFVGRTAEHTVQRVFRLTGEPCLESHTRRSGTTVHATFLPLFTTKKKALSFRGYHRFQETSYWYLCILSKEIFISDKRSGGEF